MLISWLCYFLSSLRRGDQSTVFCMLPDTLIYLKVMDPKGRYEGARQVDIMNAVKIDEIMRVDRYFLQLVIPH